MGSVSRTPETTVDTQATASGPVVAIPAYNEAATIASIVLAARRHASRVIVVDDGSTDTTAELAREAGAHVIRLESNGGKGGALKRAFSYARNNGVECLVTMDADWQHDPLEIPALSTPVQNGDADIVIGSRYIDGEETDTPLHRRVGQRVLDAGTTIATGASVSDSQSGYRAFSRDAIQTLEIAEHGFGVETQMLDSAHDQGLTITEVPISVSYDVPSANTENSFFHGVHVVDVTLRIIRDRHPLLFFGLPGMVLMLSGLGFGTSTVATYQAGGNFYIGEALFASVLVIIGMFALFSALIMNMISNKLDDL